MIKELKLFQFVEVVREMIKSMIKNWNKRKLMKKYCLVLINIK